MYLWRMAGKPKKPESTAINRSLARPFTISARKERKVTLMSGLTPATVRFTAPVSDASGSVDRIN